MSLTGNLEDLPLLDIIQIVSFSKKTGYLSIKMDGGDGGIVFSGGLVVAAFTAKSPPADDRVNPVLASLDIRYPFKVNVALDIYIPTAGKNVDCKRTALLTSDRTAHEPVHTAELDNSGFDSKDDLGRPHLRIGFKVKINGIGLKFGF